MKVIIYILNITTAILALFALIQPVISLIGCFASAVLAIIFGVFRDEIEAKQQKEFNKAFKLVRKNGEVKGVQIGELYTDI